MLTPMGCIKPYFSFGAYSFLLSTDFFQFLNDGFDNEKNFIDR